MEVIAWRHGGGREVGGGGGGRQGGGGGRCGGRCGGGVGCINPGYSTLTVATTPLLEFLRSLQYRKAFDCGILPCLERVHCLFDPTTQELQRLLKLSPPSDSAILSTCDQYDSHTPGHTWTPP